MSDSVATLWFLDTSSLLSMAVDEEIEAAKSAVTVSSSSTSSRMN